MSPKFTKIITNSIRIMKNKIQKYPKQILIFYSKKSEIFRKDSMKFYQKGGNWVCSGWVYSV